MHASSRTTTLPPYLLRLTLGLLCLCVLAGCSLLPKKDEHSLVPADTPPSFALQVQCSNSAVRDLLSEHLDLQRYRHLPDLSAAEIDNLMNQATQDASDLLATQGYINPEIQLDYLPADDKEKLPRIVVKVEHQLQGSGRFELPQRAPPPLPDPVDWEVWVLDASETPIERPKKTNATITVASVTPIPSNSSS